MDYQKITYDILAALIEQDKEFFLQNSHFSDSCKDAFIASIDKDISTKTVMVCDLEFVAGFDVTDYKKRMFGSRAKRASATCRVNVHWIVDGVSSPLPGVQEPRDGYSKGQLDSYVSFVHIKGEFSDVIDSVTIEYVYD